MIESVVKNNLGHDKHKTIMDIMITKTISDVLVENQGNRITVALIHGLASQLTHKLCSELGVNTIPAEIMDVFEKHLQNETPLSDESHIEE